MEVTGHRGVVKTGYNRAAEFVRWTLTTNEVEAVNQPITSTIVAKPTLIDPIWIASPQLSVGLQMGTSRSGDDTWWVWDKAEIAADKGTISMMVMGKPSIRTAF